MFKVVFLVKTFSCFKLKLAPAPAPAPALAPALPVVSLGSARHGDGNHLVTEGTVNILTSALEGRGVNCNLYYIRICLMYLLKAPVN